MNPFQPPNMTLGPMGPVAQAPMGVQNSLTDTLKPVFDLISRFQPKDDTSSLLKRLEALSGGLRNPSNILPPFNPGDNDTASAPASPKDYLSAVAKFESGDNPNARNPSGATGVYQFMPQTWKGLMQEAPHLGLTEEGIKTREQQDKAMRYYTGKSAAILKPLLNRNPTGGELYLLHLLGHAGGPRVLKSPDAPLSDTVDGAAIRSNPFLQNHKTGADLVAYLNKRFGG